MPELPEVETIKRGLSPRLRGKVIHRIIIPPDPKGSRVLRRYPSRRRFIRKVTGRKIVTLKRRAKYLLFELDSGETMIIHLGMSGQLLLRPPRATPPKHARIIFTIAGAGELFFVDPRKFGEVYLYSMAAGDTVVDPFVLGPEPLGKSFHSPGCWQANSIAGAHQSRLPFSIRNSSPVWGNIYTDEALFPGPDSSEKAIIRPDEEGDKNCSISRLGKFSERQSASTGPAPPTGSMLIVKEPWESFRPGSMFISVKEINAAAAEQ